MLRFLGRGSAFADEQNAACFVDEDRLVLIDCGMSAFHLLRHKGPDGIAACCRRKGLPAGTDSFSDSTSTPESHIHELYVLVTHTHGDHVGGIPMLIHYAYYIWKLPVTIVAPSEEVRQDLEFLFDRLEGCSRKTYTLTTVDTVPYWSLQAILTSHAPELEGRCFGFRLMIDGRSVIYTGDTSTLAPFLPYLDEVPDSQLYTEASTKKQPVHLYVDDMISETTDRIRQGAEVFVMHLDDEQSMRERIEGTAIRLAPLYNEPQGPQGTEEDTQMSQEHENMLKDIFAVSEQLYAEMKGSSENYHSKMIEHLTTMGKVLSDADRASFWKWDKANHTLWTLAATGTDRITIPDNTGLVGKSLAEGRVIVTNDPYNDPNFNSEVDKKTGYVTKSILVMPVSNIKGEYIGAYQVINKLGGDGKFDEVEDCRKLSLAAIICGLALESDVFLEESYTDKLTGLKNRMGFFSDFNRTYFKIIKNPDISLSLFISDIDKFKSVNDTYGHNAGDEVLKHVAKIMSDNCRECDGIYRWGGEEFIMIMTDANMEKCAAKAEELRKLIEESSCEAEGHVIRHTMSFGVTEFNPAKTIEENISVADAKLYLAKEGGRNQVVI